MQYAEHNELLSLKCRLHLQTIDIAITDSFCFSPFLLENCMNLCSVEDFAEISVSFDAYFCKCPKILLCYYLRLYLFQQTNSDKQTNKYAFLFVVRIFVPLLQYTLSLHGCSVLCPLSGSE